MNPLHDIGPLPVAIVPACEPLYGSENEAGEDDAARTAINMAGSPTFFTLDIYLTT